MHKLLLVQFFEIFTWCLCLRYCLDDRWSWYKSSCKFVYFMYSEKLIYHYFYIYIRGIACMYCMGVSVHGELIFQGGVQGKFVLWEGYDRLRLRQPNMRILKIICTKLNSKTTQFIELRYNVGFFAAEFLYSQVDIRKLAYVYLTRRYSYVGFFAADKTGFTLYLDR